MLDILYKDHQIIALNKLPGIAVQPDKTGDVALQAQAEAYCRQPLHLVHRLDRPVSGIVVFAKTKSAMTALTEQFRSRSVEKTYLAVVQNLPLEPEGILVHFLRKNETKNISIVASESDAGVERAELRYRHASSSERYHLLEIQLITGRHHQIRAQLAAIGCPIKGDVKYGFRRSNRDRSIHLHAWRLAFDHPVSGDRIRLEASLPEDPVWQAFGL
ncbi:MAG: RluA family pseudouridine synthase [Haliscomenobacteraceae bacterium CHB4]|nr:tRNA pseudouridine synthase C [Saprospiraceae bacterium]MCE7926074.1 RluA family pseudouridine synthase [Haliscomenobacteraceae bacterium CHB4]